MLQGQGNFCLPLNLQVIISWILSWMLMELFMWNNQQQNKYQINLIRKSYIQSITMEEVYYFQAIEYRNGLFEGFTKQSRPHGFGLFFDDDSALYSSIWKAGVPNGRTAVFISQAKYFYGQWQMSKPHGFNVFRSGDIVLLGNYTAGKLTGRFMIIFQKQGFVTIVSGMDQIKESIQKKYFSNQQELKLIANKCFESIVRVDDYFELIFFLKHSFCLLNGPIKLEFEEGDLKFGYDRGLGVIFDEDNSIRKVGYMNTNKKICGLGASFGITNQEGNFETGNVIRYNTGNKPVDKLKTLFKGEHIKSIFYRNDFVPLRTESLISVLEETLRKLIDKIVEIPNTERNEGGETVRELNDSLEYHPRVRTIDDGERIRRMKFQLDQSAGKVGSEISSPYIKYQSSRNQLKQLYFTPLVTQEYLQPEGIRFNKPQNNLPYVNRQIFLEENKLLDYRKRYDTLLMSPNSSRAQESYLDKYSIIKKEKKQPTYVKRNREKDRLLDEQNQVIQKIEVEAKLREEARLKEEEELIRQRNKQREIYQEIEKEIEREREKQVQLNRQREITFAIKKEVDQLPEIINKLNMEEERKGMETPKSSAKQKQIPEPQRVITAEAPAQTSFSSSQGQLVQQIKLSQQKSTAVKPQNHEIHYNPFLRTFVSTKYPPLTNPEQPFKNVQIVPNLNELNLRPTINSYEMDEDSLEKIKQFKLSEYKPPRYLIQGKTSPNQTDSERRSSTRINLPTPKKRVSYLPVSPGGDKLKKALEQSLTRDKSKSYLQIYQTSTANVHKQNPGRQGKSPLIRNSSINRIKKVIQAPYTPSKNKHKDHVTKKIIEIEHQKTSPEGKKTTSFERIVKKVQYIA